MKAVTGMQSEQLQNKAKRYIQLYIYQLSPNQT